MRVRLVQVFKWVLVFTVVLISIPFEAQRTHALSSGSSAPMVDADTTSSLEAQVLFTPNGTTEWQRNHHIVITLTNFDESKPRYYARASSQNVLSDSNREWTAMKSNRVSMGFVPASGKHYFHVKGFDLNGNEVYFISEAFLADKTPPTVPVINAPKGWINTDAEISIKEGQDYDSGYNRTEYRINGGNWVVYSQPFVIKDEGQTLIEAKSMDNIENTTNIQQSTIKIDREKPTIEFNPTVFEMTHEDFILEVKGIDSASGVKRIMLPDGTWVDGDSVSYTVTDNGRYDFVAEDYAGNTITKGYTVDWIVRDVSFLKPVIGNFGDIVISDTNRINTTDVSPIKITDWRKDSAWRLEVSSTQMKLAGQNYYLPKGTLKLKSPSNVVQVEGNGISPSIGFTGSKSLDSGRITVSESNGSRGEYDIVFSEDALELVVDPSTAKVGEYNATVTWELISAP